MPELSPFAIYLIFTADNIRDLCIMAAIAGGIGTALGLAIGAIEGVPEAFRLAKKVGAPVVIVAAISVAVIPSTKTLIAMFGIPALLEGTKAAAASEVGQKSYRAVNKLLDEYLNEKK